MRPPGAASPVARLVRRARESIADAAHGPDVRGRGAELFTQPLDVGVDRAALDGGVHLPDVEEQRVAALGAIAALMERTQQPKFQCGELHLGAVHHGYGRPHFPAERAFDPDATSENCDAIAAEVPRRFARLQRKYGRWGLAYLESLLRAADYAASANPSTFEKEGDQ